MARKRGEVARAADPAVLDVQAVVAEAREELVERRDVAAPGREVEHRGPVLRRGGGVGGNLEQESQRWPVSHARRPVHRLAARLLVLLRDGRLGGDELAQEHRVAAGRSEVERHAAELVQRPGRVPACREKRFDLQSRYWI